MKFKDKLFQTGGFAVRRLKPYNYFRLKDDGRPIFPYKLVFMCGREGLGYMNASLVSIHRHWNKLPEVIVISDGTPLAKFEKEMIRWPRKLEVISWNESAAYFTEQGNAELVRYAYNLVYGKKFISLVHLAKQFPFLYSDTDVLWYGSPEEPVIDVAIPLVKMGQDVGRGFYTDEMILRLAEEKCVASPPLNAGLMYLNGDFSTYPKWNELCKYLGAHRSGISGTNFTEQTAFAILSNYFNPGNHWGPGEILIRTDDEYQLGYTPKQTPGITARHYVHTRRTAFWRDFIYMCQEKKTKSSSLLQKVV